MRRNILFSAFVLVTLAMPAAAKGVMYACDLDAKRALGWVSPKMAIVFDGEGGVQVVDGTTMHYLGGPIEVRARQRGDIARLTWTISGASDVKKHTVATFTYEARLNLKTNAISVVAKPVGYPQRFSGKGICKLQKNTKGFPRIKP